ncbi:hypothetical protein GHO27_03240 [Pseudomonas helleri]|uniref:Uncharacterized protein n=1 Tax=Pseudomonas helleri TaxID=1608996 RepID=A0A6L5HNR0_9PSED|nr:hypothetical protein [Pseudomonas helleri]
MADEIKFKKARGYGGFAGVFEVFGECYDCPLEVVREVGIRHKLRARHAPEIHKKGVIA